MVVIIFLRCRLFYIFALERNKVMDKARSILPKQEKTPSIFHAWQPSPVTVYFVTPPPASTLLLWRDGFSLDNCQRSRCFPYSLDMRWRRRRALVEKNGAEDKSLTMIGAAWIAKLPENGMAQCNLCATDFSISCGGRTDVRRNQESARHAKLAKSNEGWGGPVAYVVHGQNEVDGVTSLTRAGTMFAYWIAHHNLPTCHTQIQHWAQCC